MNKTLLLIISWFILFTGCKLDPVTYPDGSSAGTAASNGFLASGKGSVMVYQATAFGQVFGESTQTMTGNTKTINGKLYYEVEATDGQTNELGYFGKNNGDYSMIGITEINNIQVEFTYLKENASAGETWNSDFVSGGLLNGFPSRGINTLIEKEGTKTVLGKTYKGVSHTKTELQYDYGSGFETAASYDFYVAKGIGIIQIDADLLGITTSTQLKSYTLK